ncbi:hypothetical protein CRM22_009495 [Opisthorchis felineus]|uniref:MBD domain-containing protein n=2 Tax=Opisthorchis felineus TaxID=147828 RepID=A0A4S2L7C4_OPIFE|nr:hypothetical protein CRM22_009495 [Opisthorchis felineus]
MIPGYFPFLSLSGDPTSFPLHSSVLHSAFLQGTTGVQQPLSSAQLLQHVLFQDSLRGLSANVFTPLLCSPQLGCSATVGNVGILGGPLQPTPVNSATGVAPLLLYPALNAASLPGNSTEDPSKSMDSHTIVRAPVIYKNATTNPDGDGSQSGSDALKSSEQSPPDRIVASYAAAAHAAALVNHQPVSKAAENFLSVTSTARPRHSKRSRIQTSSVTNRLGVFESASPSTTVPVSANCVEAKTGISTLQPGVTTSGDSERRAGWSRILDRKTGTVEYISPEGSHLRKREEVIMYLRAKYPGFDNSGRYDDLATHFVFEPIADAPMPTDSFPAFTQVLSSNQSINPSTSPAQTTETATCSLYNQSSTISDQSGVKLAGSTCRISFNPNRSIEEDFCLTKRRRVLSSAVQEEQDKSVMKTDSHAQPVEHDQLPPKRLPGSFPETDAPTSGTVDPLPCSTEFSSKKTENCDLNAIDSSSPAITKTDSSEASIVSTVMAPCVLNANVITEGHLTNSENSAADYLSSSQKPIFSGTSTFYEHTGFSSPSTSDQRNIDTVAKVNTETVTTGLLHSSLSSSSFSVLPSVVPYSDRCSAPNSEAGPATPSQVTQITNAVQSSFSVPGSTNQTIALNQLIATARLAQVQQQQQQQLLAAIASLSADTVSNHSLPATHLVNSPSQLNPLLLSNASQCSAPWNTGSWMELVSSTTANPSSSLQQQLMAAAAIQQQQQQQAALSILLQKQQQALSTVHPQLLSPVSQVQAYLAAVQRQFFPTT